MSGIRPVEFDWSDTCIDDDDLQAVVDAHLRSDQKLQASLCAAAGIGYIADTRGLRCPFPVREMRSVMVSMSQGDRVILLTDDPVAKIDIPHAVMEDSNYLRVRIIVQTADVFLIEKS
ncbi:sulfurtransferase TusA family protein [Rhizobium sp. P44RR-XXIV]|uniref:sulfurtransferase TusA family protein n=1 Tax=Rhizobium sp. P44RR-XXIV TaxID=1921145 RepID=UPI0009870391|nr:sulfurtransferase TusA family protein [Rhizobium sp. P44RR-XXIV]TIX90839.1 hypothetical protein BSK43_016525 [Rhizobium sp. P44RR-XXIV]